MLKFQRLHYRLSERKGQTMTEYALILAGVALAALGGYTNLGATANAAISSVGQLIASSGGSSTTTGSGGSSTGGSDSGGDSGGGDDSGSGHHHHHGGEGGGSGWGGHHHD